MTMDFAENFCVALRFAKDIVADPMDATKEAMTLGQAVYFLFLVSLPAALLQFVAACFGWTTVFDNLLFAAALSGVPVLVVLVIPLYIAAMIGCAMALAALVQIVGKIFGLLEFGFERTSAAAAYAMVPVSLFGWLFFVFALQLPAFAGTLVLTARAGFGVWTLGLSIIGLMNQHRTTLLKAALAVGIPVVAVTVAVAAVGGTSYLYSLESAKTGKTIGIFGVVCAAGSEHSITVSNDGTVQIGSSELEVYVDGAGAACAWSNAGIAPGWKATCETTLSTGAGAHRVKVVGPSNSEERFSYC